MSIVLFHDKASVTTVYLIKVMNTMPARCSINKI